MNIQVPLLVIDRKQFQVMSTQFSNPQGPHFIGYGAIYDVSYRFYHYRFGVMHQRQLHSRLKRAPSKFVETTPYELWFSSKPKLSFLKVWSCDAYMKKGFQPDKLEPKSEKCVFIGYPKVTIGQTFYHRSEGKLFVAKMDPFQRRSFSRKK